MADQKPTKRIFGRGRGKPNRPEGPWSRSKKLDETHDVRPPKKDEKEFVLTKSGFPPLPGVSDDTDDQFDDSFEPVTPSKIDTGATIEKLQNKDAEQSSSRHITNREITKTKEGEINMLCQNGSSEGEKEASPVRKAEDVSKQVKNVEVEAEEVYGSTRERVDITNSNLSPHAPEFVPRGFNMNSESPNVTQTSSNNKDQENNNQTQSSASSNVNDTAANLADLDETISFCYAKLIETPASYDELIEVVTPHFLKYMKNADLRNETVQSLYSYAIQDPRFSYFAVKILVHLIKIMCTQGDIELRNTLLRHTQEEVQYIQNVWLTDPNVNCVNIIQPFLTFMSELYIQLEVSEKRLPLIGHALVDTLKKLLASVHIPIKERLKLIISMIKLTGLSLDEDDRSSLDGLFADLASMVEQEQSNVDSSAVQSVTDIILLRNLRWGFVEPSECVNTDNRTATSPNHNHHPQPPAQPGAYESTWNTNMPSTSGVFYGPDGLPICYEEQLFLEVETDALNNLHLGDQGEISPNSTDVYDEGYDEAYEEFLKTIPGYKPQ